VHRYRLPRSEPVDNEKSYIMARRLVFSSRVTKTDN
jgi:hypothetical protein